MMKRFSIALVVALALGLSIPAAQAAENEYYKPYPSGVARYKVAAMDALVTPAMRAEAALWHSDRRVQELIVLAQANDALLYDGFRLVRFRGCLVTNDALDAYAVGRAVMYFNVTEQEAKAWLAASRLMQFSKYKDDGAALVAIEQELLDTAGDFYLRLQTYLGQRVALSFMPRIATMSWHMGPIEALRPDTFVISMPKEERATLGAGGPWLRVN